ncbi:MAG: hypothetical protein GX452_07095 [Ignavibacteriales bacterium]|nr:hypothetical protein [Ignavibacteriales bacterium]
MKKFVLSFFVSKICRHFGFLTGGYTSNNAGMVNHHSAHQISTLLSLGFTTEMSVYKLPLYNYSVTNKFL